MLFFMLCLIFCRVTYVTNKNAGSALFSKSKIDLNCWTKEEIAKLRARKAFEEIIPPAINPERINNQYIKDTIKYFNNALLSVQKGVDNYTAEILKTALYDTIGAHLKAEILPTVRFAYYAGYVSYRNARQLHDLLDQIKVLLNTQGVGWRQPSRVLLWSNLTVAKITIGAGRLLDPCACLTIKRDANECIHLPAPKLDDTNDPTAIALPFKTQGLVSLTSPNSENILLKYYTTACRCILHSSPAKCRHADFVNLNNNLWHWMKRDVASHLVDERLYAAYGGVLRIAAAVQNYGKGLSRRNLFEYQDAAQTNWNPWKTLSESYIYINADWTPTLYVCIVFVTAIIICLLQICYNYIFGEADGCRCKGNKRDPMMHIGYSKTDSNFPAVLPQESTVCYNNNNNNNNNDNNTNQKRRKRFPRTDACLSSTTHKVYDLNDNTEKLMAVITTGSDDTTEGSTTSKGETEEESTQKTQVAPTENRPKSPPKIETSIAQLTIEKPRTPRSEKKVSKPMYSTSTLTRSDITFCQERKLSDSVWSVTSSSTSGKSVSSTSSKTRSQRSRSSRDLAWARHVISRHSRRGMQSPQADIDGQSFMTSASRR